jgi:hypothetical protein
VHATTHSSTVCVLLMALFPIYWNELLYVQASDLDPSVGVRGVATKTNI